MTTTIALLEVDADGLTVIQQLARTIWYQHYPGIITNEQIEYLLTKMYSVDALTKQVSEGQRFYFIQQQETPIGFIAISEQEPGNYFIHKFYISGSVQNRGIGSAVLDLLIKKFSGMATMRLTVNRQNFKSINFYFKKGFKIERVADFDIGNGYVMNDFVMVWQQKANQ